LSPKGRTRRKALSAICGALAERHQPKRPSGMGLALMGFANRKARHEPMPLYGALQATCQKGLHVRKPYM